MKGKVHVLIPYTTEVACGQQGFSASALYREQVTCKRCRESELFKKLSNLPKRLRK